MSKGINKYVENQIFDKKYLYNDDDAIISDCFDHFKLRYKERFKNEDLEWKEYWDLWIVTLRGHFLHYQKNRKDDSGRNMIRIIGNYIKDDKLYRVVYRKIKKLNIYIPLTIMYIEREDKVEWKRLVKKIIHSKINGNWIKNESNL